MNSAWRMTIAIYLEIIELAMKHGKKEGDSMQEEFDEVRKSHTEIQYLGETDKDIDQLTGDLRENGKKVLNLNEIERRKNNVRRE